MPQIPLKLPEHIICKSSVSHFTKNELLTLVQHGVRAEHACESQLLLTTEVV